MMRFTIECDPLVVAEQPEVNNSVLDRWERQKGLNLRKKSRIAPFAQGLLFRFLPFRPHKPLKGPLELELTITFPWRESDPSQLREKLRIPKDTKPDCDNLAKMVLNVMTKLGFWEDDAQVASLLITKQFGEYPGYSVFLWRI